jgi:hypothetical protein
VAIVHLLSKGAALYARIVSIPPGKHQLGPGNARLSVLTHRAGAAAKAGHDLVLRVTAWEATIVTGDEPTDTTMELGADATSLRVVEGSGGFQALQEEDVSSIHQTIEEEVLVRESIHFHSTRVHIEGRRVLVEGDLRLVGSSRPVTVDLHIGEDGELSARAVVTQSLWGMKPYSALFGALKVKDEVVVVLEGQF